MRVNTLQPLSLVLLHSSSSRHTMSDRIPGDFLSSPQTNTHIKGTLIIYALKTNFNFSLVSILVFPLSRCYQKSVFVFYSFDKMYFVYFMQLLYFQDFMLLMYVMFYSILCNVSCLKKNILVFYVIYTFNVICTYD